MQTLRRTACAWNCFAGAPGKCKSQKIDVTFIEECPAHAETMRRKGVWVVIVRRHFGRV